MKDNLGSASVVTDASGVTVGEDRFYPFGETRLTTGTMFTDKLFTGQRNTGLGIYHYGARFYSPKLGRFLSADSIVPSFANPQSWNRYSYTVNNPLRYTDPTGHYQDEGCGTGGTGCNLPPPTNNGGSGGKGDKGKDDDASVNPKGGGNGCTQDDFECLLHNAIDGEFDPYAAFIPNNGNNTDLAIYYNGLAFEAYSISGYNLNMIAILGIDNPMTVYDFANAGVPIEWIEMTSPNRRTPGQAFFIQVMHIDSENVTNYEPNYLHAVMDAHPDKLQQAKQNYYDALINTSGNAQTAYELWKLTDELMGPDLPSE